MSVNERAYARSLCAKLSPAPFWRFWDGLGLAVCRALRFSATREQQQRVSSSKHQGAAELRRVRRVCDSNIIR